MHNRVQSHLSHRLLDMNDSEESRLIVTRPKSSKAVGIFEIMAAGAKLGLFTGLQCVRSGSLAPVCGLQGWTFA
jgi:hypothetical protein